ncbi:MAG: hypothetical protein HRF40_07380, partial [Nitrososphaera sp.]
MTSPSFLNIDEVIDRFEPSHVCVVSFGPVLYRNSGYFMRCWDILEALSRKVDKITLLEFPESGIEGKIQECPDKISIVKLNGNKRFNNRISTQLMKLLTFDPLQNLYFQFCSFVELYRNRTFLISADLIFVEGSLIPAANIVAKIFRKNVVLDTHSINKLLAAGFKSNKSLAYYVRNLFWHLFEKISTGLSDVVVVVSEKEKEFVIREYHIQESKIVLVPHISSMRKTNYDENDLLDLRWQLQVHDKKIVTFLGDLTAIQNRDAAEYITKELAPSLVKSYEDAVFLIIGRGEQQIEATAT